MAASKGFSNTPLAEPMPANTRPTSPRGIIPMPMANRFTLGCPMTVQPVITLPITAAPTKKAARIKPARFSATAGFKTPRSALAPTVTKKIGAKISAIGMTCRSSSLRLSVSSNTKPAAKAPKMASRWIIFAKNAMARAKVNAGINNAPRVCNFSESAIKLWFKNLPNRMAPIRKALALTTK